MRCCLAITLFALVACTGGSSPFAGTTSQASAGASPAATSSPAGATLSCRLPVTWSVKNGETYSYKAGFLTFPNQVLVEDSAAPAASAFYDRGFAKWLPVRRQAVSPDGKSYAYGEGNAYVSASGKLHVVDVAAGADRVIYSGGSLYAVVDFAAEGIYVTNAVPEGYARGLWLEDRSGGQPRLISNDIVAPVVGGGAAWGLDFNAADPSPGPGGLEGPKNRLLRYDLQTGAATPWFYRPGSSLYVTGFDAAGRPFVSAGLETNGNPSLELWLVTSSTEATIVFTGTGVSTPSRLAAVDSHGVWFDGGYATPSTVWLYAGGSVKNVATVDVSGLTVAGGCIP